jgi:3',5'-cyclic AMP phosphodiesterase CpdA
MRTLVHLSDLHFGRVDALTLEPLSKLIESLEPHVVVVSGDLTQRARRFQFREACAFLDTLPRPQIVVPGNHDIPLWNVWKRFASPLERFRSLIARDVEPFYVDEEIAVMGFNTARSSTWKSGRLNEEQFAKARERLAPLPPSLVKVVVTHHPFEVLPGGDEHDLVGRARQAMAVFAALGADLFLSGHLHVSHTAHTADRYQIEGHSALVIHAGTATSTRQRGEVNSFNVLSVEAGKLTIVRFDWNSGRGAFIPRPEERYVKGTRGWEAA